MPVSFSVPDITVNLALRPILQGVQVPLLRPRRIATSLTEELAFPRYPKRFADEESVALRAVSAYTRWPAANPAPTPDGAEALFDVSGPV